MINGIKVKFIRNHEHKGSQYRHGTELTVTPEEANLFFSLDVAEKVTEAPAPRVTEARGEKGAD